MKKLLTISSFLIAPSLFHATAHAAPTLEARCEEDSLDPDQARGRNAWAERCGYLPEGLTAEDLNHVFDGGGFDGRPVYPIFREPGTLSMAGYRAPVVADAPCDKPANLTYMDLCTSSCYTPAMRILLPEGYIPVKRALEDAHPHVIAVSTKSTLGDIRFVKKEVEAYTRSLTETEHAIVVLRTELGRIIKVTPNHPLVSADGRFVDARNVRKGDSLLNVQGRQERIASVQKEAFRGKVYNLRPKGERLKNHIVVAEGFLAGSSWVQNIKLDDLRRQVLRAQISEQAISGK